MRILLDECIGNRSLRNRLTADGHDVTRSVDELGAGVDDRTVFDCSRAQQRVLVTYNNEDFARLVGENPDHPGLVLIYQENRPTDATTARIADALSHVEGSFPTGVAGKVIILNQYFW